MQKMSERTTLDNATYARIDEILRIGSRAIAKAQEESRRMGVPNVYSINGFLYYELPNGELSRSDPFADSTDGSKVHRKESDRGKDHAHY